MEHFLIVTATLTLMFYVYEYNMYFYCRQKPMKPSFEVYYSNVPYSAPLCMAFALQEEFPISPQDIENSGIPLLIFQPNGSPFRNSNPTLSDGAVAALLETNQLLDNYVVNPVAFNTVDKFLRESGLDDYKLFRFTDALVIFVNESDYTFIHAGAENNLIDYFKSTRL